MALNPPPSFALRPMPHGGRKPKNLGEFIARVNAERGSFRNVTEETLREEIQTQENGVADSNDVKMDLDSEDEADSNIAQLQKFQETLAEVNMHAAIAHQTARTALNFVSLLLTKDYNDVAGTTLGQELQAQSRDLYGTLSTDKLTASNVDERRLKDLKIVSTGWKFTDIDKTADSLLSSASRLQNEISLETKYWAEVLAVSEKGWSVTRVPRERHTLGVRYGFTEAAPDFRNTSLATMRRSDDGTVELDCGRIIGESQRLFVKIEKNGKIVGSSSLPAPLPSNAPLEDRVLEARNTIFAQELWHEINREGRLLLSYNIQLEESAISYSFDENSRIIFSLQALGELSEEHKSQDNSESARAESLGAALHLLLAHAHRLNNHRRSQPSLPGKSRSGPAEPYNLLRPIIAYLLYEKSLEKTTRFVSNLTSVLQSAGITTAMFKLTEPPVSPPLTSNSTATRISPSEALVNSLLAPSQFQIELTVNPETRLLIHGRTMNYVYITTHYQIYLLPPLRSADGLANPLLEAYPPTEPYEGYQELNEVMHYVRQAVIRVLVDRLVPKTADDQETSWAKDINGTSIQNIDNEREEIFFDIAHPNDADGASEVESVALRLGARWIVDKRMCSKKWTWTLNNNDDVKGSQKETLEQVVRDVMGGLART